MIVSEMKPWEEIAGYLEKDKKVFLVGCKGCAEASHTGGEPQVKQMKNKLESAGKTVSGYAVVDILCNKALVNLSLKNHEKEVKSADSLLIMTCGIGVQATAAVVDKVVHPACNTINLGGSRGEWQGSERCRECGDCVLDITGGICPLTACTKGLINGPCGGAKDGKCEVEPDVRECGWQLIYNRLKKLGKLQNLTTGPQVKKYSLMQPPKRIRSTIMWSIDNQEKEVTAK